MLVLAVVPGRHADRLVCMLTSRLHRATEGFDEVIGSDDEDFAASGLKVPSLVVLGRLAVVSTGSIEGSLGVLSAARLARLRARLAAWLSPPST